VSGVIKTILIKDQRVGQRFIALIDTLYDNAVKLVASAADNPSPARDRE